MHPLDPLSAEEFRRVAAILKRDRGVTERWRFAGIELREPEKGELGDHRQAIVVCWNREDGAAYRAVVSLDADDVQSWERLGEGVQPNLTPDEWHECDHALKQEPWLIEALAKRGITDLDLVLFDVWGYRGHLLPEAYPGRRLGWTDTWFRSRPGSNPYANPVNGLHCIEFFEHLRAVTGQRLLVIWDGSPIHRRVAVKEFVTQSRGKVVVEQLPGYAPDLNPWDEGGWHHLKNVEMRNVVTHDLEELQEQFYLALDRLRQKHRMVQSFFAQAGLSLRTI